jgi:hypothetical protein
LHRHARAPDPLRLIKSSIAIQRIISRVRG